MTKRISIIIGFTPFHLIPMKEIVHELNGEVFFFHPLLCASDRSKLPANVKFLGDCSNSKKNNHQKYFFAGCQIRSIVKNYSKSTDIYVPHPFNPLSNYAFFASPITKKYIYQDGLLNYYDAVNPLSKLIKRLVQKAKAASVGLPYKLYGGHLSGIDASVIEGGFFTHPDNIVHSDKFLSIKKLILKNEISSGSPIERSGTIFLDQPIQGMMSDSAFQELRRRTVEFANGLGERVFYKPHYAQHKYWPLDPDWVTLDLRSSLLPAELLVKQLNIKFVVSFCSSALVNISLNSSSIECYATAAHVFPVNVEGRSTNLAEVLSRLGVKIAKFQDD